MRQFAAFFMSVLAAVLAYPFIAVGRVADDPGSAEKQTNEGATIWATTGKLDEAIRDLQ